MSDAELIFIVYYKLLKHPHDKWRAENQELYSRLRDSIASHMGKSAEWVQNNLEYIAQSSFVNLKYKEEVQ